MLTYIVQLHDQHLHKLDKMIDDIGNKLKKLKVQAGFHFSIDRAIAQIISDSNKLCAVITIFERVINSVFDQKLAPGALSIDILETIVNHIKDTANWTPLSSTGLRNKQSFSFFTYCLWKRKTFSLSMNSSYFPSTSTFLLTSLSFQMLEPQIPSQSATLRASRCSPPLTSPIANEWDKPFSARATLSSKPISSMTAWSPSIWAAQP